MDKRWTFLKADRERTEYLANTLQVPEYIAEILVNRGITDAEEAK